MTNRQREVFIAIREFIDKHHYAPTVREIGLQVGVRSTATIAGHLRGLRAQGYIEWSPTSSRTIRIVKDSWLA